MEAIQQELRTKLGMKDAISLADFREDLLRILGNDMISIVLYGNATLHDYHPESFDKNVLIIVRRNIDTNMLRSVMKPVQRLKKMGFEAMFITKENLISSTDVFPIKYHSMKESHVVMWGEDLMEELKINPVHIRLICEQDLRHLSQELDKHFLYNKGKQLRPMLLGVIMDFIETLRVAVLLKTDKLPSWDDAINAVGVTFEVDTSVLHEIIKVRNGDIELKKKEFEPLYDRFLTFVDKMVARVDDLE